MYQVPLKVYEQLKGATPEEKREIVLRLIEEHPDHRLELPERDGLRADLRGVDLSRETLQELVERWAGATPPWWDALYKAADLRDADLQGASLDSANLQGACLWNSNLQDAYLSGANLQGAHLWYADLQRSVLWRANLQGTELLRADLRGAELWHADLQGAQLNYADLQSADLRQANLRGAYLWLADLQGADLRHANLQRAKLICANLQGADLWHADLQRADLRDARLQGVDLSSAKLTHCHFNGAFLDRTRLRREQLGGAVAEELDGDYRGAKIAYLGLKQNFSELGDYAASSWAYRKERRMEKREALKAGRYAKALGDQIVELVCDYGEGFWRVLVCLALLWLGLALIYGITGHVLADRGPVYSTTRNPFDLLSFSLATMVTLEAPGLHVHASLLMRILMPLQAALGIFFLGLLGFVAGNRIRRS